MLDTASWLPLAEKLGLQDGRSRRTHHECGEGRTLLLSREGPKLKAWCFRCNDGGTHTIEEPLNVRIARLADAHKADADACASAALPDGLTNPAEWPATARLWFARAGMHGGDIGALGARYDPSTGRVVVPCGPHFWVARALNKGQQPKYLAPNVDKSLVLPRFGQADRITLVEDILSAYKVGQVAEGWCMLGTSLQSHALRLILQSGKAVNVWLDNDLPPVHPVNRGQIAARKVSKQLRALGVSVRNIVSHKDPKLMTYDEIKELTS